MQLVLSLRSDRPRSATCGLSHGTSRGHQILPSQFISGVAFFPFSLQALRRSVSDKFLRLRLKSCPLPDAGLLEAKHGSTRPSFFHCTVSRATLTLQVPTPLARSAGSGAAPPPLYSLRFYSPPCSFDWSGEL
jgi:hypothetical protein